MITVKELRSKRVAAEISAITLATKSKVNRSRLSGIECGHFQPTNDELNRLATALDELMQARTKIQQTAAALGWPGVPSL